MSQVSASPWLGWAEQGINSPSDWSQVKLFGNLGHQRISRSDSRSITPYYRRSVHHGNVSDISLAAYKSDITDIFFESSIK